MADERKPEVREKKPGRIVVDSRSWGGVDLPDIGKELEALPPAERNKEAKGLRIGVLLTLAIVIVGLLIAAFNGAGGVGMPKFITLLLFVLICGIWAVFRR